MGLPPHPVHTGPDWVEVWRDRLERTPQWPIAKFTHQRRDAYWRHASACEDWASIEVPVLAIGGWIDSYQDACLAVLEHVTAPRRAVIGPWAHTRPHVGWPGPTLEHRDLLARWFDRWLHDVPNGVEHEPALVAYLREGCPRTPYPARVDGTWRAFAWPSSTRPTTTLHLADGGLAVAPTPLTPRTWAGPAWVGHAAPWWSAGHAPAGHGADMRRDDDASLVFDTPVLTEPLAILGHPLLTLEVSADRPVAMVAVRLEDVHPDGYSSMVCRGGLNLTRRDSDEAPTAVHPGARYTVEVPVVSTGTVIPAGHRLRLAIAGGHFPITWPAPEPFALTIHGGTLRLPAPDPACERPAPLLPERDTALDVAGPVVHEDGPAATWRIEREHVTGRTTHRNTGGWDAALPEGGRSFGSELVECTVLDDDPTSCRALSRWVAEVRQPGVHAVSRSRLEVWCTTTTFELEIDLAVERDGAPFFARGWRESFPRDLM
jgi:predicted acyl esterase